jgi:hypothetical protein
MVGWLSDGYFESPNARNIPTPNNIAKEHNRGCDCKMVKSFACALLIFIASGSIAGSDDPFEGGELYGKPRPYKMTTIKNVSVTISGGWNNSISSDETPEHCSKFLLKASLVRSYFGEARRASHKEYVHDLDMSRCYASGQIAFSNGDRGVWHIDQERRGMIALSDGRKLYFFCQICEGKVFYPQ